MPDGMRKLRKYANNPVRMAWCHYNRAQRHHNRYRLGEEFNMPFTAFLEQYMASRRRKAA
jgi:hypothetical protein